MTIIANLDLDIQQYNEQQNKIEKELQIFGVVWPLIPAATTITMAPLMNIQAVVQLQESGEIDEAELGRMMGSMFSDLNDALANIIREDKREEFRKVLGEIGIPIGIIGKVIEAIMQVFDAAPLVSETTNTLQVERDTSVPASIIDSGNYFEEPTARVNSESELNRSQEIIMQQNSGSVLPEVTEENRLIPSIVKEPEVEPQA